MDGKARARLGIAGIVTVVLVAGTGLVAAPSEVAGEEPVEPLADANEALLAWAHAQCDGVALARETGFPEEEIESAFSVLERTWLADESFAVVQTPCHIAESGAYNLVASVVSLRNGVVAPVTVARWPSWARATTRRIEAGSALDPNGAWNPHVFVRNGAVFLSSRMLYRGIGDSGHELLLRREGARFELVEIRVRDGGSRVPETIGPYPIVEPEARRCNARLETDRRGTRLVTTAGATSRRIPLALRDARCVKSSDLTLRCGEEEDGHVEYTVIAAGDDWRVVRLGAAETTIATTPRACAL